MVKEEVVGIICTLFNTELDNIGMITHFQMSNLIPQIVHCIPLSHHLERHKLACEDLH